MMDQPTSPPGSSGSYRAVTDGDLRDAMDLRDFLVGLGVVMQLPGKQPTAANEVVQRSPKKRRSRILALVTAVSVVVALAIALPALLPNRSDALPSALLGSWHTLSPKYADRGFEIRSGALHLKRGEQSTDVAVLPIRRVRVTPRGSSTGVKIQYQEGGVLQTLDLTLHNFRGTTVELRNRPDVIWRRQRSASDLKFPSGMLLPPGAYNAPPPPRR